LQKLTSSDSFQKKKSIKKYSLNNKMLDFIQQEKDIYKELIKDKKIDEFEILV